MSRGDEIERLGALVVEWETVETRAGPVHIRALTADAGLVVSDDDPHAQLKMVALGLADAEGAPLFTRKNLNAGVKLVREMPLAVVAEITTAMNRLNGVDGSEEGDHLESARRDLRSVQSSDSYAA